MPRPISGLYIIKCIQYVSVLGSCIDGCRIESNWNLLLAVVNKAETGPDVTILLNFKDELFTAAQFLSALNFWDINSNLNTVAIFGF
jgi:hypothetical protein